MDACPRVMRRGFATLGDRQVHYRHGGASNVPLVMLHASPGSARQLAPLAGAIAQHRRVIAPDRPGNGDSDKLAIAEPEIADYARAELDFLDAIATPVVDLYGSHTGACVAIEMAILAPARVRRLVLDGIALFSAAEVALFLREYAPPAEPDRAGVHLAWAFQFCRDQAVFFPWFRPTADNARQAGLPTAQALHDLVVEVLKSLRTYHLGYRASFRHDTAGRLPLVPHETLAIAARDDPLHAHLAEALRLLPRGVTHAVGRRRDPGEAEAVAALIAGFLAAD